MILFFGNSKHLLESVNQSQSFMPYKPYNYTINNPQNDTFNQSPDPFSAKGSKQF